MKNALLMVVVAGCAAEMGGAESADQLAPLEEIDAGEDAEEDVQRPRPPVTDGGDTDTAGDLAVADLVEMGADLKDEEPNACDLFTTHSIPLGTCIKITGWYEVRLKLDLCEQVQTIHRCATATNVGQCRPPALDSVDCDGETMLYYVRPETGRSYSVEVGAVVAGPSCSLDC